MDESDSSALRDPLLPVGGENDDDEKEHLRRPCSDDDDDDDVEEEESEDATSFYDALSYPPGLIQAADSNARKILAIAFSDLATKSIWGPNILSVFMFMTWKNHLAYIGILQATMGVIQTVTSIFATRYCNSQKMSLLLVSMAGILANCGSVMSIFLGILHVAFHLESSPAFVLFLAANGLWGLFWGMLETALPMVLVESVNPLPESKRQQVVRWNDNLPLGGLVGNLFAILIFYQLGNEWANHACGLVLVGGVVINLFGVLALCCVRQISFDDQDYGQENYNEYGEDYQYEGNLNNIEPFEPLLSNNGCIEQPVEEELAPWLEEDDEEEEACERVTLCSAKNLLIPLLIFTSDVLSSVAGGISTWYFPLFLAVSVGVSPILLQTLCLLIPFGQKLSVHLTKALAGAVGPSRACILLQWIYVALLQWMIVSHSRRWTVCAVYVLHGSLMNSTYSLSKGMIQTHVPVEEQHLWDQSPQQFLWSLSGLLGAYLASQYGFVANLHATAAVQLVASVPLILLYCLRDPSLDGQDAGESFDGESYEEGGHCTDWSSPTSCKGKHNEVLSNKLPTPFTPETEQAESECDHESLTPTSWVV